MNSNAMITLENTYTNTGLYCSMVPDTDEKRIAAYKLLGNADRKLSEAINMNITITDFALERTEVTNAETGEVNYAPRISILTADGVVYGCVSGGILRALKRLCLLFGEPTWKDGITVTVRQREYNGRRVFDFDLV